MRKIILIMMTCILAFSVFSLTGCGKDDAQSLIGKWVAPMITREFKEDGTVIERTSLSAALRCEGTYTVDGDKISIIMIQAVNEENGKSAPLTNVTWNFSYKIKGDTLTLNDLDNDDVVEYTLSS